VAALLDVRGLQVDFEADTGPVRVLNGMDLTVEAGQSVGVVGESGSGKTVLLRAILGLLQDQWRVGAGAVTFDGQDLRAKTETQMNAIRGAEIALTTPEPRKHLNPLLRIGEQIVNVLRAHGRIDRRVARDKAVELLRAVGIPAPEERVFSYPHEMSGGMCQRVIIAMALAHSPRLLLADEPTAGLDVTISRQILDLMSSLIRDTGSSLLLVSRDLGVVAHYCQTIAVVYAGQVVETAPVAAFFEKPAHPYSRRLLRVATAAHETVPLAGGPAVRERTGTSDQMCSFAPRCPIALPTCRQAPAPLLGNIGTNRAARCIRAAEILSDAVNPWP
jgi:oligopeptide/dipeptide ABC transporter ATP-binding protein